MSKSIHIFICPSCGRGNLYDNFCEDCVERGEFSEFVPVERIAELERHNELLRAVARQTESLLNMSAGTSGGRQEVHDRVVALNKKYQAAIDGGALDGEK